MQIERARAMASGSDIFEMSECPATYATCSAAGCSHVLLMAAAAAEIEADRAHYARELANLDKFGYA